LLQWAGLKVETDFDYQDLREREVQRLSDSVEQWMDWDKWNQTLPDFRLES